MRDDFDDFDDDDLAFWKRIIDAKEKATHKTTTTTRVVVVVFIESVFGY